MSRSPGYVALMPLRIVDFGIPALAEWQSWRAGHRAPLAVAVTATAVAAGLTDIDAT